MAGLGGWFGSWGGLEVGGDEGGYEEGGAGDEEGRGEAVVFGY